MDFPIVLIAWLIDNMVVLIAAGGLLPTAIFGLVTYHSSVKIRRAEWLYKLYHQFYVESDLKEIRQIMDSTKGISDIEKLIAKDEKTLDETSLDKKECDQLNLFTDYCNFFEFMMIIQKSTVLDLKDIKNMFNYYLELFRPVIIREYLERNGFEHLSKYLKENPKD